MDNSFNTAAEHRMPPHPRGVVELLRKAGHRLIVREAARNAGLLTGSITNTSATRSN
jgi:hypothetical protein